jgi:hypothetical protein
VDVEVVEECLDTFADRSNPSKRGRRLGVGERSEQWGEPPGGVTEPGGHGCGFQVAEFRSSAYRSDVTGSTATKDANCSLH